MGAVSLVHGAGARETLEIIEKLVVAKVPLERRRVGIEGVGIDALDDGAAIKVGSEYIVFSTDSFTVNPVFFPGGNIGELAATGTINDLVMMGARPIAFMDAVVVEEGFPLDKLEKIIDSMINMVLSEGLSLIGGDFKVMPRGSIDGIVITGLGVGVAKKPIIDTNIRHGDKIVVTAPIAEHGTAIIASQLGMEEGCRIKSDARPLTRTVLPAIEKYSTHVHAARDPTRGGLASVLSEWASSTGLHIVVDRSAVPIRDEVREFLDALGIDPLSVACEGVAVLAVSPDIAEDVVKDLRSRGEKYACIIGEVRKPENEVEKGRVTAYTEIGGRVFLEPRPLNVPRIC